MLRILHHRYYFVYFLLYLCIKHICFFPMHFCSVFTEIHASLCLFFSIVLKSGIRGQQIIFKIAHLFQYFSTLRSETNHWTYWSHSSNQIEMKSFQRFQYFKIRNYHYIFDYLKQTSNHQRFWDSTCEDAFSKKKTSCKHDKCSSDFISCGHW